MHIRERTEKMISSLKTPSVLSVRFNVALSSTSERGATIENAATRCHSALDAESRLSFFWIPAFAGMTIFSASVSFY